MLGFALWAPLGGVGHWIVEVGGRGWGGPEARRSMLVRQTFAKGPKPFTSEKLDKSPIKAHFGRIITNAYAYVSDFHFGAMRTALGSSVIVLCARFRDCRDVSLFCSRPRSVALHPLCSAKKQVQHTFPWKPRAAEPRALGSKGRSIPHALQCFIPSIISQINGQINVYFSDV